MNRYNWYKAAGYSDLMRAVGFSNLRTTYPEVTFDQFQSMTWREKQSLGWSVALTPEVQRLFFTGDYDGKDIALQSLAKNHSITAEIQQLFFKENYNYNKHVLEILATNPSITPQTQRMFFKPEYWVKGFHSFYYLAQNTSITTETQILLFTEEYQDKNGVINYLKRNPSFLKGFTLQDLRAVAKAKEARYFIYGKRLKTIREKIKL